ncbi:phosphohistidine phosphatase SixA [Thalassolituus maritimus]|uniref:Phosphohistidine phosphatase SixA n=1 Tax=Thalassolituus maritimus TaxID=484498 RepID=A0ABQ0A1E2_9GAMM
MARIFIIRHGSAVPGMDLDSERVLTHKGEEEAAAVASWVSSQVQPGAVLYASPYRRAQQTATAVAAASGLIINTLDAITPSGSAPVIADMLTSESGDVVVVSHLPLVGRLASLLVEGFELDQPWSPAECWLLSGDIIASGCMSVEQTWYPALASIG